MIIGGHGHSHRMYSRLEPAEQEADIEACLSALEHRLGSAATTFAYPFGQASTFTDVTVKLLRSRGVTCAFANEAGAIASDADSFALKRVDPKDPMLHSFSSVSGASGLSDRINGFGDAPCMEGSHLHDR